MTIGDVIKEYPETIEIMLSYGLHCVGCSVQYWESIEGGCKTHGFEDEKIDKMVKEMNEVLVVDKGEFTVSDKAITKLNEMAQKQDKSPVLRINVVSGGCSGFQYHFDFDEIKDNDETMDIGGITFVMNKDSKEMLKGSKMEYIDTLNESGFRISNPNATESCACGKSFN
jgi:iron-sulfur cluster assembly accessory protein